MILAFAVLYKLPITTYHFTKKGTFVTLDEGRAPLQKTARYKHSGLSASIFSSSVMAYIIII